MARPGWLNWLLARRKRRSGDGPLLVCPTCGQTYNPVYILFCARCGEPVPDENGKLPRRNAMDGFGSRGGAVGRVQPRDQAASGDPHGQPWLPTQAVEDIVAEYRNRLNEKPEDSDARYNLGLAYYHAGLWEQAAAEFRLVVEREPGYADAWSRLAVCQARLAETDGALNSAREAVRLDPQSAVSRRVLEQLEGTLEQPDATPDD